MVFLYPKSLERVPHGVDGHEPGCWDAGSRQEGHPVVLSNQERSKDHSEEPARWREVTEGSGSSPLSGNICALSSSSFNFGGIPPTLPLNTSIDFEGGCGWEMFVCLFVCESLSFGALGPWGAWLGLRH